MLRRIGRYLILLVNTYVNSGNLILLWQDARLDSQ